MDQTVDVRPDPRAKWTQSEYEQRFAFLKSLGEQLSDLDAALNRLDALRKGASPPLRSEIERAIGSITSNPRNSEDSFTQNRSNRVRERVMNLQGVLALSQGPPLPPHLREREQVDSEFAQAMAGYRTFLRSHALSEK